MCAEAPYVRCESFSDHVRVGGHCDRCGADRRGRVRLERPTEALSFRRPPGPGAAYGRSCSGALLPPVTSLAPS